MLCDTSVRAPAFTASRALSRCSSRQHEGEYCVKRAWRLKAAPGADAAGEQRSVLSLPPALLEQRAGLEFVFVVWGAQTSWLRSCELLLSNCARRSSGRPALARRRRRRLRCEWCGLLVRQAKLHLLTSVAQACRATACSLSFLRAAAWHGVACRRKMCRAKATQFLPPERPLASWRWQGQRFAVVQSPCKVCSGRASACAPLTHPPVQCGLGDCSTACCASRRRQPFLCSPRRPRNSCTTLYLAFALPTRRNLSRFWLQNLFLAPARWWFTFTVTTTQA